VWLIEDVKGNHFRKINLIKMYGYVKISLKQHDMEIQFQILVTGIPKWFTLQLGSNLRLKVPNLWQLVVICTYPSQTVLKSSRRPQICVSSRSSPTVMSAVSSLNWVYSNLSWFVPIRVKLFQGFLEDLKFACRRLTVKTAVSSLDWVYLKMITCVSWFNLVCRASESVSVSAVD